MSVKFDSSTTPTMYYPQKMFNTDPLSENDLKTFVDAEYRSEKETWEKRIIRSVERLEDVVERKNLLVEGLKA